MIGRMAMTTTTHTNVQVMVAATVNGNVELRTTTRDGTQIVTDTMTPDNAEGLGQALIKAAKMARAARDG